MIKILKDIAVVLGAFVAGLLLTKYALLMPIFSEQVFALYILYGLMFVVGLSIGIDQTALKAIKETSWKVLTLPLGTIVGTLLGAFLFSFFLNQRPVTDYLAVASGFGYYSLSSVFITEYRGAELGVVALISNIIREVSTLILAPFYVRYIGKLAPITAGGATSMDATLPVIITYSGSTFVVVAIVHGLLVDLSVPFLVTLFCKLS